MSTFPIRCFTCGKVINHLYRTYKSRIYGGESPYEIMDDMRLERMCCRRMFISHATDKLEEYQLMYPSTEDRIIEIGVKSTTFADTRAKIKAIIDED